MRIQKWKFWTTIIALFLYWLLLSIDAMLAKEFELPTLTEWWINTLIFFSLMVLCIFTYRTKLNIFYRLLFLPAYWLAHAALTIPAAFVLGILMYDSNHIRTSGEHRAVFILASLPILIFAMNKSKLFTKTIITK